MIDAYASEPHYADHMAAVWHALPAEARGTFHGEPAILPYLRLLGVGPVRPGRPGPGGAVMVAGFQDHREARRVGRPVVYLEHGAGQTYMPEAGVAPHPSYSGGDEHEGTVLFLSPSETVAGRWRAAYPGVPAVAVGCPKLDHLHAGPPRARARTTAGATVAVSFHSDVVLCPETRSAFRHYDPSLPSIVGALRDAGAHVIGHAHPRLFRRVEHRWRQCGAEPVADFAEVAARADVYCVDTSSTLYEAASLGLPTVAMNAPWYRRDVEHGLRFWALIPGAVVDGPAGLRGAIVEALADPPWLAERRAEVVAAVYAACDGEAAARAADAILAVAG